MNEVNKQAGENVVKMLVTNKNDLEEKIEVEKELAKVILFNIYNPIV